MLKKGRLEYLFPNINNERKYKWLENAEFSKCVQDSKIIDFSFEEYLNIFLAGSRCEVRDENGKDITNEFDKKQYAQWREHGGNISIFELSTYDLVWDNTITQKLAIYLERHPLLLPSFIQWAATDIIGLFLCEDYLFYKANDNRKNSHFSTRYGRFCFNDKERSERKYRFSNFEAKYKFSLLISVLDNLLDLGVNLDEYEFGNLTEISGSKNFSELRTSIPWNEFLISKLPEKYVRYDGLVFSKEELINYISFSNLHQFLNKVVELSEIEYYIDFIEEAKTMDPNQIYSVKDKFRYDMSEIPKENLVDIKVLCQNMQKKLKEVGKATQITVLNRKIDALKESIEKYGNNEEIKYSFFRNQIEDIYNDLTAFSPDIKEKYLQSIKELLTNINIAVEERQSNIHESSQSDSNIFKKIDELETRMQRIEKKVDSMEKLLLDYLEHGGKNPLSKIIGLSQEEKEEQINIVTAFKPTTIGAKLRKTIILGILKTGVTGLIAGSVILNSIKDTDILPKSAVLETTQESTQETTQVPIQELTQVPIQETTQVPIQETAQVPIQEPMEELKPLKEMVIELIRGKWGNGEERKIALEEAGYDYEFIQSWVNKIIYKEVTLDELDDNLPPYALTNEDDELKR